MIVAVDVAFNVATFALGDLELLTSHIKYPLKWETALKICATGKIVKTSHMWMYSVVYALCMLKIP